jgi:hypothetical protein
MPDGRNVGILDPGLPGSLGLSPEDGAALLDAGHPLLESLVLHDVNASSIRWRGIFLWSGVRSSLSFSPWARRRGITPSPPARS